MSNSQRIVDVVCGDGYRAIQVRFAGEAWRLCGVSLLTMRLYPLGFTSPTPIEDVPMVDLTNPDEDVIAALERALGLIPKEIQ